MTCVAAWPRTTPAWYHAGDHAEFLVPLADAYEAIPFRFVRPANFARWSSGIGLSQLDIPPNPITAQDKLTCVFLVFYARPFVKCIHHNLTTKMWDVFEGHRLVDQDKKFYVLTATETVDMYHGGDQMADEQGENDKAKEGEMADGRVSLGSPAYVVLLIITPMS